jgi:hypothetical protein
VSKHSRTLQDRFASSGKAIESARTRSRHGIHELGFETSEHGVRVGPEARIGTASPVDLLTGNVDEIGAERYIPAALFKRDKERGTPDRAPHAASIPSRL